MCAPLDVLTRSSFFMGTEALERPLAAELQRIWEAPMQVRTQHALALLAGGEWVTHGEGVWV